MSKKNFPRKPFAFGKFIVEYREIEKGVVSFLKEELNTQEEADAAAERLEADGKISVVIKQIG